MSTLPSYHTNKQFDVFFETKLPKHLKEGFDRFKRIVSFQSDEDDLEEPQIHFTLLQYYFGSHVPHEFK
jgi:hypothetical protein